MFFIMPNPGYIFTVIYDLISKLLQTSLCIDILAVDNPSRLHLVDCQGVFCPLMQRSKLLGNHDETSRNHSCKSLNIILCCCVYFSG